MKTITVTIFFCLFIFSCTSEPKENNYQTIIKNSTTSDILLEGYDSNDNLILNYLIPIDNSYSDCIALTEDYLGLSCQLDSLKITFNNDKGYICTVFGGQDFNFLNKNIFYFEEDSFTKINNSTYQFTINQEDFNNAFDLP